jgi:hypothetical protein
MVYGSTRVTLPTMKKMAGVMIQIKEFLQEPYKDCPASVRITGDDRNEWDLFNAAETRGYFGERNCIKKQNKRCRFYVFLYILWMSQFRKQLTHNGKAITLHDYRGLEGEDYANAILHNMQLAEEEQSQDRLVLIDATDTVVSKEVMKAYKTIAEKTSPKISKTGVIGATGIQQLFVATISNLFKLNVRAFRSKEQALDWLTSE